MYKNLLKACLLLLISSAASARVAYFADVRVTQVAPDEQTAAWQRMNPQTPKYPIELAKAGIRGCGVFKVQIDADGNTQSVDLVSAVPKKGLSKPAMKLVKSWKWQAKDTSLQSLEARASLQQPMIVRLDFCMGGNSLEEAAAMCQLQAQYACQE